MLEYNVAEVEFSNWIRPGASWGRIDESGEAHFLSRAGYYSTYKWAPSCCTLRSSVRLADRQTMQCLWCPLSAGVVENSGNISKNLRSIWRSTYKKANNLSNNALRTPFRHLYNHSVLHRKTRKIVHSPFLFLTHVFHRPLLAQLAQQLDNSHMLS